MLLVMGGAVAAVGALAPSPFRNIIAQRTRAMVVAMPRLRGLVSLAQGSFEEWQAQVGSRFAIGGGLTMELSGVRALPSSGARPAGLARDRGFVAFFDPVGGAAMVGDLIYTVNHAQYGPLQIFLSAAPVARAPARMLAVFN